MFCDACENPLFIFIYLAGVRVKKTSGDIDVHAPIVISNAGIANTFGKLLPKEVTPNKGERLGKKYYNLELELF